MHVLPFMVHTLWHADALGLAQLAHALSTADHASGNASTRCYHHDLRQVLTAFHRAQQCGLDRLADVYYNRAAVHLYVAEFEAALQVGHVTLSTALTRTTGTSQ